MPFHDSGKTRRTMESDVELENVRNEVLRKIGRNMLLYQQVEHMFKYLVANGRIEGYASKLKANHKRRVKTICSPVGGDVARCRQLHIRCHPGGDARVGPRVPGTGGLRRGQGYSCRPRWGAHSARSRAGPDSPTGVPRPTTRVRRDCLSLVVESPPAQKAFCITIQM
jgi:hypothetical protein